MSQSIIAIDKPVQRRSGSQSLDLGFHSLSLVIPEDFHKWLGAQHKKGIVWRTWVSLGKALSKMLPVSRGRQVVGPSSLPVVVAQSEKRHANRAYAAHTHK